MDYHVNGDHEEDGPLTISPPASPVMRKPSQDVNELNETKRVMDKFKTDRSSKLLESKSSAASCARVVSMMFATNNATERVQTLLNVPPWLDYSAKQCLDRLSSLMISCDELNEALCLFAGDLQTKGDPLSLNVRECKHASFVVVPRTTGVSLLNIC